LITLHSSVWIWAINDISIPFAEISLETFIFISLHANACEQLNAISKALMSAAIWGIA